MPHPLVPDDAFPPARNDPCYCDSGKRFKHCCGIRVDGRSPPHGVGIVEDFVSRAECLTLVKQADAQQGQRFRVLDRANNLEPTLDDTRVAEWVSFGDSQRLLDELVWRALAQRVLPSTGLGIEWYEEPQLLRYTAGGFYFYHSDSDNYDVDYRAWRRCLDRDISVIIYLNDEYTGGELEFKRLRYVVRPKAGMLVWFPSDVRYEHMARAVTSGCRYALVSWAAATGTERVQAERAKRSISWATREKKPT